MFFQKFGRNWTADPWIQNPGLSKLGYSKNVVPPPAPTIFEMLKIKCGDKYLHTFQCLIQAKVYTNFHSFFELLRFNKSLSLPQKCFLVSFIQLFWKNLFTNLLPPVHCQMLFVTLLSTPETCKNYNDEHYCVGGTGGNWTADPWEFNPGLNRLDHL